MMRPPKILRRMKMKAIRKNIKVISLALAVIAGGGGRRLWRRPQMPDGWEFYQVVFRKKMYQTIEQLKIDLNQWIDYYNNERSLQGKFCEGRTPMQTLLDGKAIWKEKFVGKTAPDRYRLKTGDCQIGSELLQLTTTTTF